MDDDLLSQWKGDYMLTIKDATMVLNEYYDIKQPKKRIDSERAG